VHPVLFHLFGYPVEAEGTLYLLAAILAGWYAIRLCPRLGADPNDVIPGVLITVLAAFVGARLYGAILFGGWGSGLSFFGGLALGAPAALGYLRWKRYPAGLVADALAPLAPVLYAMFRLGCFLNGDDYGPPTALPWGLRFPEDSPSTTVPVHPTQLYGILLMVPVFLWIRKRKRARLPAGRLVSELCILLGAERFLAEFWRLGPRGTAGLSVSQWLALALAAVGAGLTLRLTRSNRLETGHAEAHAA
jgi:phosphatidylglycerol:prolipoprotein diacylglycerol transferase